MKALDLGPGLSYFLPSLCGQDDDFRKPDSGIMETLGGKCGDNKKSGLVPEETSPPARWELAEVIDVHNLRSEKRKANLRFA